MTTKTTIQLTSNFTDTTLPKDRVDPVMPDAGALVLLDFAHPLGTLSAVPATGAQVPNLLASQAATATGLTTTQVTPTINIGSQIADGSRGKVELTAKKGLHVIVDQAHSAETSGADGRSLAITFGSPLFSWLDANKGHSFYLSQWFQVTRPSLAVTFDTSADLYGNASATSNFAARLRADTPQVGGASLGMRGYTNTVGNKLANVGFTGRAGSSGYTDFYAFIAGNYGALGSYGGGGNSYNKQRSMILYRFYMEDLTVSGRTYAQVDALDNAQYTKDVLTAGGRFYGDTFTNPTTIP